MWRKIEVARDRIMRGAGTDEPWLHEDDAPLLYSAQWRKPLSLAEVNQMAPTLEVRERKGRA